MNDKKKTGKQQTEQTKPEPQQLQENPPVEKPPIEKKQVDFCIFSDSGDVKNKLVGSVFNHKTGKGFNILLGNDRYVAFPPKLKP